MDTGALFYVILSSCRASEKTIYMCNNINLCIQLCFFLFIVGVISCANITFWKRKAEICFKNVPVWHSFSWFICTFMWLNGPYQVSKYSHPFCSNQQASLITLVGYLTPLLLRISRTRWKLVGFLAQTQLFSTVHNFPTGWKHLHVPLRLVSSAQACFRCLTLASFFPFQNHFYPSDPSVFGITVLLEHSLVSKY